MKRVLLWVFLGTASCAIPLLLVAQAPVIGPGNVAVTEGLVYQCPMDADVRSNTPGVCPRCGMTLRSGIPEPTEFPMDFSIAPRPVKPGARVQLTFAIDDPQNGKQVSHFQIVHEKLFHLFVVSQDLQYFLHDHPVLGADGKFRFDIAFPRPGLYRILGDYFPDGATPQLTAKTVIVPGGSQTPATLSKDYSTKKMVNMSATITTVPEVPIAGGETRIFLHLDNADGLEKYIGAWAHMLAVSDDMIDLIHSHPYQADGGPDMRFDVYFGRAHAYRVWFQFQKQGVVNTAYFDIPVKDLD
jgi:hypothetical protein